MAPLPSSLIERFRPTGSHVHSGGGSGGGIGGGVIAAILVFMLIIFIGVFWYEYNKASKIRAQNGTPIPKGKIFKKAFLIAISVGLVSLLCAECCGIDSDDTSGGGGGGGVQQPQMNMPVGGGFVPPPMPSYQPQMDMAPITSAAQDGVLG